MKVPTQLGFPVVSANNIFEFLEAEGIRPWPKIQPTMSLEDYKASGLTEAQQKDLRFAPKAEVMQLEQPNGDSFIAFRTALKPWVTMFCLLPCDMVLIIAEWKHGAEAISLAPPSGVLSPADGGSIINCAIREFQEETGITVATAKQLGPEAGIAINCRHISQRYFPVLGICPDPLDVQPQQLDSTENLRAVLIPLADWLQLIHAGKVVEDCSISTTYLALQALGKI